MSRAFTRFWLILVPDTLLLYISLWLAIIIRYAGRLDAPGVFTHLRAFSVLFAVWLVIFFIHGLFEISTFRRYSTLVFNIFSASIVNLLSAITYFYFQPNLILTPRRFLLILIAVSFILILLWHLLLKAALKNRLTQSLYLFSFADELGEIEIEIQKQRYLGFRVLGHLNEHTLTTATIIKNAGIILPDNIRANKEVSRKLYELRTLGVSFYNHKDFYEQLLRRIFLSNITELWFLENINYKEKRFYNLGKRVVDIVFAVLMLVPFIISLPICALLVKLTSPGPLFFVQSRIGKAGKVFSVYKYRTMSGGATNTWTSINDPRITKVGKFLRKSRLDELPQIINLFFGTMSLVGPRPEQPQIVDSLRDQIPFYDERHLVKPGITGWAQLNIYAGSVEETKLKLQYDLYYIKHRSFLFDLEIILKTIYYIFTWQGR